MFSPTHLISLGFFHFNYFKFRVLYTLSPCFIYIIIYYFFTWTNTLLVNKYDDQSLASFSLKVQ